MVRVLCSCRFRILPRSLPPVGWSRCSPIGSNRGLISRAYDVKTLAQVLVPGRRAAPIITGARRARRADLDTPWSNTRFCCIQAIDHESQQAYYLNPAFYGKDAFGPNVHGSPIAWIQPNGDTLIFAWAEKSVLTKFLYNSNKQPPLVDTGIHSTIKAPPDSMPSGVLSLSANGSTPGLASSGC